MIVACFKHEARTCLMMFRSPTFQPSGGVSWKVARAACQKILFVLVALPRLAGGDRVTKHHLSRLGFLIFEIRRAD